MIYFLASVAALAGLLFGYDEGIIAVARPSLTNDFPLTALSDGFMTAAVPLGALLGAILGGRLTDRLGRRRILMLAAGLFVAGALAAAATPAIWFLVLARLLLGVAIGTAALAAPLYISEMAPVTMRGALVSTYQLAITFGILASYLIGLAISNNGQWRLMFAIGAVPGLLFLSGLVFLPETPRWLVLHGKNELAEKSLRRVRGPNHNVDAEFDNIRRAVAAEGRDATPVATLFTPTVRPALVIGVVLFFLQQLSGINAVIYYAPQIFRHAGFDDESTQLLATVGIGCVNFLVTLPAMWLVDRWGRRPLLTLGFIGTSASLMLIAATQVFYDFLPPDVTIVALAIYVASFAVSVGPLPHVMMSEIFPLRVRGPGMSMSSISNWGFNFIVVLTFPLLLHTMGLAGVFTLFAAVCVGGIAFTRMRAPETKGMSLENIEAYLRSGQPLVSMRPNK